MCAVRREDPSPPRAVHPPGAGRILRFDAVQRGAHWANALVFFVLVLTALPLYFPSIEHVVGRHVLVEEVHVWAGIAWPAPIALSLVGPWGKRMRRDIRRVNRWTHDELRWLWGLGRVRGVELDKFNPGQKLNAAFVGGATIVLLGTGIVMKWFGLFPVGWRTGATFVHETFAFAIVLVAVGHIVMALTHPDSMRSMIKGPVSVDWARRRAGRWAREVGVSPSPGSPGGEPGTAGPVAATRVQPGPVAPTTRQGR